MRSNGFQITGDELQAMVTEHILGAKTAIPATTRCLTRAEVMNCVYVYGGPQDPYVPSIPYTTWSIGGGVSQVGADPYLTCSYEYINPLKANGTIVFEMDQVGNPYLNCDLFGSVNSSPLRLDPGSNLDGMFFGGPQYSDNMASAVKIGNQVYVQANFGRDTQEAPGNWGWSGNGYGILEIYRNSVLISTQSTAYRTAIYSANLTSLTYSFVVENSVNYYIKAYTYVDNRIMATVKYSTSYCDVCNNETGSITLIGNESTFCASTSFTSSAFASLTAGNYVLAYGGNALNVSTNGTSTATMYGGGCTVCVGTTANWTYVYQNCLSCVTRNIYQDTNSCSTTYGQYKINPDGTAQVAAPSNTGACNTAQTWTDNGTVVCIDCTNVTVYKNTNPCSTNHNFYRYTNPTTSVTITQESNPSGTACVTSANWVLQYYNCASCVTRTVERDMNPCSSTYLGYTVNHGVNVGTTAPANTGACSTTQVWTDTAVVRCNACVNEKEQEQTNSCATGYTTKRWVAGGSACSTTQVWTDTGTTRCNACVNEKEQQQTNACATGSGTTRWVAGGSACSTTAIWTNMDPAVDYYCQGTTKYYKQVDTNPCSPTYNTTQLGASYQTNSTACGYIPVECYGYEVSVDDGTGDRNTYPYTYVTCGGISISANVTNLQPREICAARDSVSSTSPVVTITEIGPCLT